MKCKKKNFLSLHLLLFLQKNCTTSYNSSSTGNVSLLCYSIFKAIQDICQKSDRLRRDSNISKLTFKRLMTASFEVWVANGGNFPGLVTPVQPGKQEQVYYTCTFYVNDTRGISLGARLIRPVKVSPVKMSSVKGDYATTYDHCDHWRETTTSIRLRSGLKSLLAVVVP